MTTQTIETKKTFDENAPAVWVGCLAAYNEGCLHGEWVNVPGDEDEMREEIKRVLASSPANMPGYPCEEWGFFDYQNWGPFQVGEYESIEDLVKYAEVLDCCDSDALEHWDCTYLEFDGMDASEIIEAFKNDYKGHYDRETDYAYDLMNECYEVPKHLETYIDYETFWRDLTIDNYYSSYGDGGYYIFCQES